jgi:hypothetical protein
MPGGMAMIKLQTPECVLRKVFAFCNQHTLSSGSVQQSGGKETSTQTRGAGVEHKDDIEAYLHQTQTSPASQTLRNARS